MGVLTRVSHRGCPNCHRRVVRRSHRVGVLERFVLSAVSVRPYRCLDCDTMFYRYDGAFLGTVAGQITARQ